MKKKNWTYWTLNTQDANYVEKEHQNLHMEK